MNMSIEEAIKTAIEFESRVSDVYKEAKERITDPVGKRVFQVLVDEEQYHLGYLERSLEEWRKRGKVITERLGTVIPSRKVIEREVDKLKGKVKSHDSDRSHSAELRMLRNALEVEIETGDFYRKMVKELSAEGQQLFARFVEIEEGHRAVVQAEIDYISGTGYWFDFREFDLEAAG